MFVVSTVVRVSDPEDTSKYTVHWPVVHENPEEGYVGAPVDQRDTREDAQKLADSLNATLEKG